MDNNFRTVALALRDTVSDTYALLNVADKVIAVLPDLDMPQTVAAKHDALVLTVVSSPVILGFLEENQKINAIKELRADVLKPGFREAKLAVEDSRVTNLVEFIASVAKGALAHRPHESVQRDQPYAVTLTNDVIVGTTEFSSQVARGIALLDRERPGWADKINPETFDLFSVVDCVLGQVYGGYVPGKEALSLNIGVHSRTGEHYGFACENDDLREAWSAQWLSAARARKRF